MSDGSIVTQHFNDPLGSIMEIDGECYVKVSDKADTITKYLECTSDKLYYSSHENFSAPKNGIMLCPPPPGPPLYSIGELNGIVTITTGMITTVPTDITYNAGNIISIGSILSRTTLMSELTGEEHYPTDGNWLYAQGGKISVGYIHSRVTINK